MPIQCSDGQKPFCAAVECRGQIRSSHRLLIVCYTPCPIPLPSATSTTNFTAVLPAGEIGYLYRRRIEGWGYELTQGCEGFPMHRRRPRSIQRAYREGSKDSHVSSHKAEGGGGNFGVFVAMMKLVPNYKPHGRMPLLTTY